MTNITIQGIDSLNENERQEANRILEAGYEKLKRKTKSDFILKVVVKLHSKESSKPGKEKSKHYSIKASISGQTRSFEASSDGWDLNKALHLVIEKLGNEVEHAFHSSEQRSSGR